MFLTRNFSNFHRFSVGNFQFHELPKRKPDYYSFAGSTYWDYGDYVVRWSDHWGQVSTCYWTFNGKELDKVMLCGYCKYKDFA